MHINKAQKFVLFAFIIVVIGMMLFPPFHIVSNGRSVNFGYNFLFTPPYNGVASVNIVVLLVQWLMAILVTAASFALAASNKKKDANENKSKRDFTFYPKAKSIFNNIKTNLFMKNALLVFLQLFNALIAALFLGLAWGSVPTILKIGSPSHMSPEVAEVVIIQIVIMFLLGISFFGMRKFIKRLHKNWNGTTQTS